MVALFLRESIKSQIGQSDFFPKLEMDPSFYYLGGG